MDITDDLIKKKCQPCEGIGAPLNQEKITEFLKAVPQWQAHPDKPILFRNYVMKNFMAAIRFINAISTIAEAENHHPDIHLTSYRKIRIDLTTHALGGLTENDFILAAKIDQLPIEIKS